MVLCFLVTLSITCLAVSIYSVFCQISRFSSCMGVRVLVYSGGCDSGGWESNNIGDFRNGGGGVRKREFTCDLHGGGGSPG